MLHRSDSWSIIPGLLGFSATSALVGFGWGAVDFLGSHYLLQSTTLTAVDNSVATAIALGGVPALVLLVMLIWVSFMRAPISVRTSIAFVSVMMISFDVMLWAAPFALLTVLTQIQRDVEGSPQTGLKL